MRHPGKGVNGIGLQRRYQMADSLTITSSQVKANIDVTVFNLAGTLDAAGEDTLCQQAREAFDDGAKFLLLDLQNLEYLSSAGLRAFHRVFKMCTPKEEIEQAREKNEPYKSPYFKLAGASPSVYSVLNLAGFLHSIPFYPTAEDAIKSFSI